MNGEISKLSIGVFDSGIGGVSVLGELVKKLPCEKFIYVADSANAPYGIKSSEHVRKLSLNIARMLYCKGIKALVVGCNTATSAAINHIREELDIPVIGMEPALKPAVNASGDGDIMVMATPLTLKEQKFNSLYQRFYPKASIVPVPCPGLMELIEAESDPGLIKEYLRKLFSERSPQMAKISAVVLGCTHYCFVKKEIYEVIGKPVKIFDGNEGTARHLVKVLQEKNYLSPQSTNCNNYSVEFLSTGDEKRIIPLCERLLEKTLNAHF